MARQVHAARKEWPSVADEIYTSFLRDEGSLLGKLFSIPCSSEEDFAEIREVIEAMSLLGRRARARELAASAERVLDQRFLRGLVAFLAKLDLPLGSGGGVRGEL